MVIVVFFGRAGEYGKQMGSVNAALGCVLYRFRCTVKRAGRADISRASGLDPPGRLW